MLTYGSILEAVKKIFHKIQSGQKLDNRGALNGARKRKRDEVREKDDEWVRMA